MEERRRKIVIAGGGTGGHLFPALAVADELRRRRPELSIVFVGGTRGIEVQWVPKAGYRLLTLRISGLKGAGAPAQVTAGAQALIAVLRCMGWMIADRPHLVIGVGGYASGPAVLAAKLLWIGRKIQTMVLEQNHFPGATNRFLASRVDEVCVPSGAARRRLGGIGTVTGNPVREAFLHVADPPGADRLSLLVFGGSRGARSINRALVAALPRLAAQPIPPSIVHQTGTADEAGVRRDAAGYPGPYEVHAFLDDMPLRLAAADLVVCRAGATTLAELAAAGRPAVLVPYPHAADDHQRHNAETVVEAGGARLIADDALNGETLAECIATLNANRPALSAMGRAARTLACPRATAHIADIAESLVERAASPAGPGGRDVS